MYVCVCVKNEDRNHRSTHSCFSLIKPRIGLYPVAKLFIKQTDIEEEIRQWYLGDAPLDCLEILYSKGQQETMFKLCVIEIPSQ